MEKRAPKRRSSILKKRRSRSESPDRHTPTEKTERKQIRRISFSGKHNVREFFINEDNKETIWGASYEESTEHHVISQEQLTQQSKLQQTLTHACYNIKNDTVGSELTMDLTCAAEMSTLNATKMQCKSLQNESRNSIQNNSILRPKLQLFQRVYKKEDASSTINQVVDMSVDKSVSIKVKEWEKEILPNNSQIADSKSVFSILKAAPSKIPCTNTFLKENQQMAQDRKSVICKSPKKSTSVLSSNKTMDMDITENVAAQRESYMSVDITENRTTRKTMQMDLTDNKTTHKPLSMTTNSRQSMSLSYILPESTSVMESTPIEHEEPNRSPSAIEETNAFEPLYDLMLNSHCEIPQPEKSFKSPMDIISTTSATMKKAFAPVRLAISPDESLPMLSHAVTANAKVVNRSDAVDFKMSPQSELQNDISMDITLDHTPIINIPTRKPNRLTINQPTEICPDLSLAVVHAPVQGPVIRSQTRVSEQNPKSMEKNRDETIYDELSIEQSSDIGMEMTLNQKKIFVNRTENPHKINSKPESIVIDKSVVIPDEDKENVIIIQHKNSLLVEQQLATKNDYKSEPLIVDKLSGIPVEDKENIIFVEAENSLLIEQRFKLRNGNKRLTSHTPIAVDISMADAPVESFPQPINHRQSTSSSLMDISDDTSDFTVGKHITESKYDNKTQDINVTTSKEADQNTIDKRKRRTCLKNEPIDESVEILENTEKEGKQRQQSTDKMDLSNHKILGNSLPNRQRETIYFNDNLLEATNVSVPADSCSNSPADLRHSHVRDSNNQTLSGTASEHFNQMVQLTFISDEFENDILMDTKINLVESSVDSVAFEEVPLKLNHNQDHEISNLKVSSPLFNHRKSYNLPAANENSCSENFKRISIQEIPSMHLSQEFATCKNETTANIHSQAVASVSNNINNVQSRPTMKTDLSHRRSTIALQNSTLSETSYLHDVTTDVSLRQIKLDFAKYDMLKGLATPADVVNAYKRRYELQNQQMMERNNISTIDSTMSHPDSQNVEAPDFIFLYRNKIEMEDEQMMKKIKEEFDNKPIKPVLPIIPSIYTLVENKLCELERWHFDSLRFSRGYISLRHKQLKGFKLILTFNPSASDIEKNVRLYGKMNFAKVYVKKHSIYERHFLPDEKLCLQEFISKLPSDLHSLCPTSNELSEFTTKMHHFCVAACEKIRNLNRYIINTGALLKESNGTIFIHKRIFIVEKLLVQEYVINLDDLDTTGPQHLRTEPCRLLNESIKNLPLGMEFVRNILSNPIEYIQLEDKLNEY